MSRPVGLSDSVAKLGCHGGRAGLGVFGTGRIASAVTVVMTLDSSRPRSSWSRSS